MQRSVAWISAALMLAVAVWIVWGLDEPSKRPVVAATARASQGSQAAARPRQPQAAAETGEEGFVRRVLPPRDADAAGSGDASLAGDPGAGQAPGTAPGGADRDRPRLEGASGPGASAPSAAPGRLAGRLGDVAPPAPDEPGSDGDPLVDPQTDQDMARWAEDNRILTEPEIDARTDLEERNGNDPEQARQKVLTDAALAYYLASKRAGPDATPAQIRALMDPARTLISTLDPQRLAALKQEAAQALPGLTLPFGGDA